MHVLLRCCISSSFSKLLFNVDEPNNTKKNRFGVTCQGLAGEVEVLVHNFTSPPIQTHPKIVVNFFFSFGIKVFVT